MAVPFKYVNPKAVEEVVGKYAPLSSFMLARIIDEALDNTNKGYCRTTSKQRLRHVDPEVAEALTGVVDRMLANNLQRAKLQPWNMYLSLIHI